MISRLHQNFPNPFNPSTTIQFEIPRSGHVSLKVYNLPGQEVVTLVEDVLAAGAHHAGCDASDQSSGVYIYKLKTEGFSATRKLTVVR